MKTTKQNKKQNYSDTKNLNAKLGIFLAVMLALAMIPASSFADVILNTDNSVVSASLVKYDPAPAEPGGYLSVWVKLSNLGNAAAPNAVIKFVPQYPFTMDGSDDVQKTVRLGSQQDYVFEYKVRVDQNAVTGTNKIKFKYSTDPSLPDANWQETTFDISVRASDATLTVTDVAVENNALTPGVPGTVTLTLKNTAGVALKNIAASLDLFSTTASSATSTTTLDVPIAPVGTTTQRYVTRLGIGETAQVSFDLSAYPDAKSKLYKIPLTLTYKDEADNAYTRSDLVGVFVTSTPDITALLDTTDLTQSQHLGKIAVKVVNKGLADVKFVTVTYKESQGVQLVSQSPSVYIGKLDSDDFETVEYKVKVADDLTTVKIPVEVTYMDALNKQYTKTYNLDLVLLDGSTANGSSNTGWIIGIAVVVIVAVGLFIWNKKRKHKQK